MNITTDGLIVDDLIKSISRMKVPFCEEDVTHGLYLTMQTKRC